ncbi:hypothetical protein EPO05_01990 [Patescibacteria group bacterium]|nr:MAG: hypothetical protein EPO05_01990 [Patescibacteria group bacterium]
MKGVGEESDRPDLLGLVLDLAVSRGNQPPEILQVFEILEGGLHNAADLVTRSVSMAALCSIPVTFIHASGRKEILDESRSLPGDILEAAIYEGFEIVRKPPWQ